MERSKFISYHKGKAPQKRRARVVHGSFEDRNKYYHCVNCGFIFDIEQTTMGGDRSGNYTSPPDTSYNETRNTGDKSCILSVDSPFEIGGVCRIDSNGDVLSPVTLGNHSVSSGCPLCGNTANL
jgi:hypothetical protein